ncbi:cysteine-rich secretory protein LCCL domain-containing 1 [Cricetulus griseus]|uniref:Cysteine-rich secretory protein LCCL domain-containing 1 n=1 Tax=Cricetulus griseus TaxID=10029 RepID=A0A061IE92_CRIGR|nr:cysteine-rich secretory protein LCCL domain-containing 1 [Cricetulus griseus]
MTVPIQIPKHKVGSAGKKYCSQGELETAFRVDSQENIRSEMSPEDSCPESLICKAMVKRWGIKEILISFVNCSVSLFDGLLGGGENLEPKQHGKCLFRSVLCHHYTVPMADTRLAKRSGRAYLGDFPGETPRPFIMMCTAREWLRVTALLFVARAVPAMVVPNATLLEKLLEKYMDEDGEWWTAKQRGKRAITDNDMQSILDLHNKLRSQVYPTASNMEYMTWDVELERSAESWAETCLWEHGPANLLPSIGQNLGAHWGRYRPPTFHVQAWYDEVRDFSYPYEHECNPYCPFRCSGPVCTHYTQVVWATSSRIGCAINLCHNMNIWGQIWPKAVYLVCNYSPKGNWWGHAPYKHGRPCSACPPSFGGGCRENLCYKACLPSVMVLVCSIPKAAPSLPFTSDCKYHSANSFTVSKVTVQAVTCETTVEQLCPFHKPASHCPRVYCPRNCMQANPHYARVIGSRVYSDLSSICRAAVHAGVVRNNGGYVDVMPVDKRKMYTASFQNGIFSESLQNPTGGKAFRVFAVV